MKFKFYSPIVLLFLLIVSISGCKRNNEFSCEGVMFGRPLAATGLSYSKCRPVCECKEFASKLFYEDDLSQLRSWTLTEPFEELTYNPYDFQVPVREIGSLCFGSR
jgi:hypothetical protein